MTPATPMASAPIGAPMAIAPAVLAGALDLAPVPDAVRVEPTPTTTLVVTVLGPALEAERVGATMVPLLGAALLRPVPTLATPLGPTE